MGICGEIGGSELLSVYLMRARNMKVDQLSQLVDRIKELNGIGVDKLREMCPFHGNYPKLIKTLCITNIIFHEFAPLCSDFKPDDLDPCGSEHSLS